MSNLRVGTYGALKNYFEDDTEFKPDAARMLVMYEQVCREMFRKARFAVSSDSSRIEAAVWVAAAVTLETLLDTYVIEDDEKEANIWHIRGFANDLSKTLGK